MAATRIAFSNHVVELPETVSHKVFDIRPQLSREEDVTMRGICYHPTEGDSGPCAQLTIASGAADFTLYPTAAGLNEIADSLRNLAKQLQAGTPE